MSFWYECHSPVRYKGSIAYLSSLSMEICQFFMKFQTLLLQLSICQTALSHILPSTRTIIWMEARNHAKINLLIFDKDVLVNINPKKAGSFDPISQPGGGWDPHPPSDAECGKIIKFGTCYVNHVETNNLAKFPYWKSKRFSNYANLC